jgi:hypothetical protein
LKGKFVVLTRPQLSRWYASHDRAIRHIARHDGASADDCSLADGDTWQEHGTGANVSPSFDDNRLDQQIRLDDRHGSWHTRVL